MADITMAKANIDQKEVQFGSAISTATFSKFGAAINHINGTQFKSHSWNLNGRLASAVSGEILDGLFVFPYQSSITALTMSMGTKPDTDSICEINIYRLTAPSASPNSIFTTTPKITGKDSPTMESPIYLGASLVDTAGNVQDTVQSPSENQTGTTLPVFNSSHIHVDQWDALYLQAVGDFTGQDLNVTIYFRPR